jgi:hypothetical protein
MVAGDAWCQASIHRLGLLSVFSGPSSVRSSRQAAGHEAAGAERGIEIARGKPAS